MSPAGTPPARRVAVLGACGWAFALARAQTPAAPASAPLSGTPSFSDAARRRLLGGSAQERERFEQQRRELLAQAQRHLQAGTPEAAQEVLERAALMRHAADTELALAGALMAQGQYQRALAACAHTAGAHREERAGVALYAWLLHLGGHSVVARRLLEDALRRAPGDALLQHTRDQLERDWPLAGPMLMHPPARGAPWTHGAGAATAAAAGAKVVGSATLMGEGSLAVLGRPRVDASARLWVRNGLGQTVEVKNRQSLPVSGTHDSEAGGAALEVLNLERRLPAAGWVAAAREPFAGSPGFMVEYAPDPLGGAAWPLLRQGFFAGVPGLEALRPLGLQAPEGARGGPVFDAFGRLAGVALAASVPPPGRLADAAREAQARAQPTTGDRLVGIAWLADSMPGLAAPTAAGAATRVGPEVPYELALRGALQVLTDARDA